MVLGDTMAFLCISLDSSSVNAVHIIDGDLIDIDKYTIMHNNAQEILKEFPEKIEELNNIYNLEDTTSNIRVRIFLPNDKEQFVMYKKHLAVFNLILQNRTFLEYSIDCDPNLFDRKIKKLIETKSVEDSFLYSSIKTMIEEIDKINYISLVRKVCEHYLNYIEDNEEEKIMNIDDLYRYYLQKIKQGKLEKSNDIVNLKKSKSKVSPFAVFEHPNFFKVYGKSISPGKPIFILGGLITENTKAEYKELYENCKKCFSNPVYYPFNANVSSPLNEEFVKIYSDSLIIVVNGNGLDENLLNKIAYACRKNITVLILVSNEEIKAKFNYYFNKYDTVIIKDYIYNDYESQKEFANIMVGFYIKQHKNNTVKVGE